MCEHSTHFSFIVSTCCCHAPPQPSGRFWPWGGDSFEKGFYPIMSLPKNFSYSDEHEWIDATADAAEGTTVKVGITSVATERLGEVVFAELPQVGDTVEAGETCGEVESTKSVSDLYAPVTGTVVEVNDAVHDDYSVINADPFGAGWLFSVEVSSVGPLMTAEEYAEKNGVEA